MDPMDIVENLRKTLRFLKIARDSHDLLIECCVEFINLISSESNDVCNKEDNKRTIAPEHVLWLWGHAVYEQHKYETMQDSQRSVKMNIGAEMTEEEEEAAAAEQQRMFAETRARMNGGVSVPQPEQLENTTVKSTKLIKNKT